MPFLFVPYWVIAVDTPDTQKTDLNNVTTYLDELFQAFQGDANPYLPNSQLSQIMSGLQVALRDDNLQNRDLLYSLFCYYYLANTSPFQALKALGYLTNNYLSRFKKDHPLLYLHTVESFINLGKLDEARVILKNLLSIAPDFIPAQVYQWQLETDAAKKSEYYQLLKKNHPAHWIVKQI